MDGKYRKEYERYMEYSERFKVCSWDFRIRGERRWDRSNIWRDRGKEFWKMDDGY